MMPSQHANCYWRFSSYCFKSCEGVRAVRMYHIFKTLILVGVPCGPMQNPQTFCRTVIFLQNAWGKRTTAFTVAQLCTAFLMSHPMYSASIALPAIWRPLLIYPVNFSCIWRMPVSHWTVSCAVPSKGGTIASSLHRSLALCLTYKRQLTDTVELNWLLGLGAGKVGITTKKNKVKFYFPLFEAKASSDLFRKK